MSDLALTPNAPRGAAEDAVGESGALRAVLIVVSVIFLGLFLLLPLAIVFVEAFAHGVGDYFRTFFDPDVQAAVRLTLTVAAIVVPLNTAFWTLRRVVDREVRFSRLGRYPHHPDRPSVLRFAPVVSGLIFVLVFGAQGFWGRGRRRMDSTSSSRFQALFSRPSLSPFRLSPAR